jgi:hypothetical protein
MRSWYLANHETLEAWLTVLQGLRLSESEYDRTGSRSAGDSTLANKLVTKINQRLVRMSSDDLHHGAGDSCVVTHASSFFAETQSLVERVLPVHWA